MWWTFPPRNFFLEFFIPKFATNEITYYSQVLKFTSKYWARPLLTSSRIRFASINLLSLSVSFAASKQSGFANVFFMTSRQVWSTVWNSSPSVGICLMISCDPNMGPKYCHVAWQFNQLSTKDCKSNTSVRHAKACVSNGLIKGDAHIERIFTICSSKIIWMSSMPPTMYVPESLYGNTRNSMPSQSFNIFSSDFSNEYSLLAAPLRFRTYKIKVLPKWFFIYFSSLEQHFFWGANLHSPLGDQKQKNPLHLIQSQVFWLVIVKNSQLKNEDFKV